MKKLLCLNKNGIYCEAGDFYIDPWRPVDKAIITHAHSDHSRPGNKRYLSIESNRNIIKHRLGEEISFQGVEYGEVIRFNGVNVSLHPAGHIMGSAQVRVEYKGEVWVASGDYKVEADCTCKEFELIKCNTFITESTFGLPIYNWCPQEEVFDDINEWWRRNSEKGIASIVFAYALGKAQRVISGLATSTGKIYTHGAVENINYFYRQNGVKLPETMYIGNAGSKEDFSKGIIIAPPSADNSAWLRTFKVHSKAAASGWMQVRGVRRRRSLDRGFVLSDHSDWKGLISAIKGTGAENIYVTHGYSGPMVRWLNENGWKAETLRTEYEGERDEEEAG
jgi:putative mRNA 3-end processing factor